MQIKCEECSTMFASKNFVRKHKIKTFASEVEIMTHCSAVRRRDEGRTQGVLFVHEDVKEESNGRSRFKNHCSAASNPRRRGEELIFKRNSYHIQC